MTTLLHADEPSAWRSSTGTQRLCAKPANSMCWHASKEITIAFGDKTIQTYANEKACSELGACSAGMATVVRGIPDQRSFNTCAPRQAWSLHTGITFSSFAEVLTKDKATMPLARPEQTLDEQSAGHTPSRDRKPHQHGAQYQESSHAHPKTATHGPLA